MRAALTGGADHGCSIAHRGSRCTELRLHGGERILLDYAPEPASLLHYLPVSSRGTASSHGAPSCMVREGWWHLQSPARLRVPLLDANEVATIRAVLVSSAEAMLALPLLTERTHFRGAIYATYAAMQLGAQLMIEFARIHSDAYQATQHSNKAGTSGMANAPPVEVDRTGQTKSAPASVLQFLHKVWAEGHPAYTEAEALSCARRVGAVSFGQVVQLNPDSSVVVTAFSSGSSIGGANWLVEAYGARFSLLAEPAAPAPTLKTTASQISASKELDLAEPLHGADVLLLRSVRPRGVSTPTNALVKILAEVSTCVGRGGSVLFPCSPCAGVTPGLIQALATELKLRLLPPSLTVPIVLLSPIGSEGLAHVSSLGEWLDEPRGARAFLPEMPFDFDEMVADGRLVCAPSASELAAPLPEPCIVFASDPSLRAGEAARLLDEWRQPFHGREALLVLTSRTDDCEVGGHSEHFARLLAPFMPLGSVRPLICVLDTRVAEDRAANLVLDKLSPKLVVIPPTGLANEIEEPAQSTASEQQAQQALHDESRPLFQQEMQVGCNSPSRGARSNPPPPSLHFQLRNLRAPVVRMSGVGPRAVGPQNSFIAAALKGSLAEGTILRELPNGMRVGRASFTIREGEIGHLPQLKPLELVSDESVKGEKSLDNRMLMGTIDTGLLLRSLQARGLQPIEGPRRMFNGAVEIEVGNAKLRLQDGETIVLSPDFETATLINEAICEQLYEF